jgi:hypothetical protein
MITINVSDELWKYLNQHKEAGETFENVIWGFIRIDNKMEDIKKEEENDNNENQQGE